MKDNKKIFIEVFTGIAISLLITNSINVVSPNFPLAVLSIVCTITLAALAIPSLSGLSDSKLFKILFFITYSNTNYIFFSLFQVVLAIVSIRVDHTKLRHSDPTFFYHLLVFLFILDIILLFIFIKHLLSMNRSPNKMLEFFKNQLIRKLKKIKKGPNKFVRRRTKNKEDNYKTLVDEIHRFWQIAKDANMGNEKKIILETFEQIQNNIIFSDSDGAQQGIQSDWQVDSCTLVAGYISETCTGSNGLNIADNKNVSHAITILNEAWRSIIQNPIKEEWVEIYRVCPKAVKELAIFSVKNDYNKCIEEAIRTLCDMMLLLSLKSSEFILDAVASYLREIGILVVQKNSHSYPDEIIMYIISCYQDNFRDKDRRESTSIGDKYYLFEVIYLMAFIWETNPDTMEISSKNLRLIKEEHIIEIITFSSKNFQIESARIKRFMKAVQEYSKPNSKKFFSKLLDIFKNQSSRSD